MAEASKQRARTGLRAAVTSAAAVAVATYASVLSFGFVYDDHWTVEGNRALARPLGAILRAALTGGARALGIPDATRPTMIASVWADRRLFGADPSGYHLHSLLLYAAVTAVATLAAFALTRRRVTAFAAGALFAAMPVHAEVVASVNYREDLYAALGAFAVLAFACWPLRRPPARNRGLAVAVLFAISLFAKESAAVAVPLALLAASTSRGMRALPWRIGRSLGVLAGVTSLWGVWRVFVRATGGDDVPTALVHRGVAERVLRTARYLVRGVWDGLVPTGFSPDYATERDPSPGWLVPLVVLVIAAPLLARRRRLRPYAIGLLLLLAAPLATSPLVSPINERADRYLFVATLGSALAWGALFERASRFAPPRLRWAALGLIVLPLALRARVAASPWGSDATLWQAAVERAPDSARAWTALARERRLASDLDGADRAADRAVALDPTFLRARVTRVYNRLARGEVDRARDEIAELDRLGGARQAGLVRARRCASLTPPEARVCIAEPP